MKLSSQEEYGLRCLLQLARAGDAASLTIAELSKREGLSAPNVAKMLRLLRRSGFVRATRGQQGGYALARPAATISVGEALSALGGRIFDEGFCDRHAGAEASCAHLDGCSIKPVLQRLQEVVDSVLGHMTLSELLSPQAPLIRLQSRRPA